MSKTLKIDNFCHACHVSVTFHRINSFSSSLQQKVQDFSTKKSFPDSSRVVISCRTDRLTHTNKQMNGYRHTQMDGLKQAYTHGETHTRKGTHTRADWRKRKDIWMDTHTHMDRHFTHTDRLIHTHEQTQTNKWMFGQTQTNGAMDGHFTQTRTSRLTNANRHMDRHSDSRRHADFITSTDFFTSRSKKK